MHLTQIEIEHFYKLWYSLIWGINKKHKVIEHFSKPVYGKKVTVSQSEFKQIRDKMWDNPKWIDEFLKDNDNGEFTEQERGTILSWRKHFIKDRFVITRHLKNYSVLMSISENQPITLYGVNGISDSFNDMFQGIHPILAEIVLIPFGNKIIYDTFCVTYNLSFGSNIKKNINMEYRIAKSSKGVITSLNEHEV